MNIHKSEYSEKEKEELVNTFINTLEEFFPRTMLNYDITGSGYGISKGDGYFGIRKLRNKFQKVGYGKMSGVSCSASEHKIQAGISFVPVRETDYCSFYVVVPFEYGDSKQVIEKVVTNFSHKATLEYGFGYQAKDGFDGLTQGYEKRTFFTYTTKGGHDMFSFENKLSLCSEGKIYKIAQYNILNKSQSGKLRSLGFNGIESLDQVDILILNIEDLSELEQKASQLYA